MKKVWKYVIITLLLLLGLCCVGILYLFFVPGASIFKITYINYNIKEETLKYSSTYVSTIELNSRAYEIEVLESNSDQVYLTAHSNSFGFVHTSHKDFKIQTKHDNNTLTFTITEPYGFATTNLSNIKLYLPTTKAFNLSISNNRAEATINSSNIQINNLKYTTEKGEFKFKKGILQGSLNLDLNKGDFLIYKDVETNNNNLTLSLTSGSFKANNSTIGDVTIEENSRGVISIGACRDIRENQKSAGGQITVVQASHVNITAGDTIVTIDEIANSAIIDLTKSGKVKINKITGISSISTNSGNISIDEILSPITLYSDNGDINVSNAHYKVSVKSNNGDVKINFANSAESYLTNHDARVLYASIKDGNLKATGVEHVGVASAETQTILDGGIKITGKGRVYISMINVYGTNSVAGNNGNITVIINKDSQYVLKTSSEGGDVRVNLTQTSESGGYRDKELTTTFVNCSSSSHSFIATTTNGSLTILDTNFA